MASGSGKGSGFERDISAELSFWWTDNERDDVFYRSHGSGGRATRRAQSGQNTAFQHGDITTMDPIGFPLLRHWCIELKTGYAKIKKSRVTKTTKVTNWSVTDCLDTKQEATMLEKFWHQCAAAARLAKAEPVLICRRPLLTPVIVFSREYRVHLIKWFGNPPYPYAIIAIRSDLQLFAMPLRDFFRWAQNLRAILEGMENAEKAHHKELPGPQKLRLKLPSRS